MKKYLTIFAFGLISTMAANAQQPVLRKVGGFKPVPASVTCDGKGRIAVISENDDDEMSITILNRDLQTEAEIQTTSNRMSYEVGHYSTLIKVSDFVSVLSCEEGDAYLMCSFEDVKLSTGIEIKDRESFRSALKSYLSLENTDFFEWQGYDYCLVDTTSQRSYYDYYMYGKSFPNYLYAAKNDRIYTVGLYYNIDNSQVNYIRDYVVKNSEKLTWTKQEEEPEKMSLSFDVVGTRIVNIDNGDNNVDVKEIFATQNLFNNDDKWEYIVQAYDPSLGSEEPQIQVGWNSSIGNGYIRLWGLKPEGDVPEVNCLKIMSQDGTCLGVLNFPGVDWQSERIENLKVFIIKGKPHFLIECEERDGNTYTDYAYLYRYDSDSNGITLIERTPVAEGHTYNLSGIEVDGSAKGIVIKNGKKVLIGK